MTTKRDIRIMLSDAFKGSDTEVLPTDAHTVTMWVDIEEDGKKGNATVMPDFTGVKVDFRSGKGKDAVFGPAVCTRFDGEKLEIWANQGELLVERNEFGHLTIRIGKGEEKT